MAALPPSKSTHGPWRWSGGGLLVLLSLGLHSWLLSLPIPSGDEPLAHQIAPTEVSIEAPVAAIDVVRLPAAAAAPAVSPPQSAISPPRVAQAPPPTAPSRLASPQTVDAPSAEPAVANPPEPDPVPPTLDDRLRDPAEYSFNREVKALATNEITLITAVVPDWLETLGQGLNDDEAPVMGMKLPAVQVPYALDRCLNPPPAEGLVGVIVTPSGELVKAPVLLDSTGYGVLDDKALELALDRAFPPLPPGSDAPNNPRAHWLPVQVQYSPQGCPP